MREGQRKKKKICLKGLFSKPPVNRMLKRETDSCRLHVLGPDCQPPEFSLRRSHMRGDTKFCRGGASCNPKFSSVVCPGPRHSIPASTAAGSVSHLGGRACRTRSTWWYVKAYFFRRAGVIMRSTTLCSCGVATRHRFVAFARLPYYCLMAPFEIAILCSRPISKRCLVASPSEMPCLVAISSTALRVRCVTLAFTDAVNSGVLMSKHPLN